MEDDSGNTWSGEAGRERGREEGGREGGGGRAGGIDK